MRIALAVCVVLGSTLCGKAASDAVRRRYRVLSTLAEDLQALRIHMTGMLMPVQCALEKTGCAVMRRVAEGMRTGCSAAEAWQAVRGGVLRRGGPADALSAEDLLALDALFGQLGQSGREEQEALLGASAQAVGRLRDGALKKAGEADRLYVSLGFLIGLMLALIVI
jgi:stage III sporulation protein AB